MDGNEGSRTQRQTESNQNSKIKRVRAPVVHMTHSHYITFSIYQRLKDLGWGEELENFFDFCPIEYYREEFNIARPLTDRGRILMLKLVFWS